MDGGRSQESYDPWDRCKSGFMGAGSILFLGLDTGYTNVQNIQIHTPLCTLDLGTFMNTL
jgi:hypothetical protein